MEKKRPTGFSLADFITFFENPYLNEGHQQSADQGKEFEPKAWEQELANQINMVNFALDTNLLELTSEKIIQFTTLFRNLAQEKGVTILPDWEKILQKLENSAR